MLKQISVPLRNKCIQGKASKDDMLEIIVAAEKNFTTAYQLEGELAYLKFKMQNLIAENEFLIRWVNSRIQDTFKEP